jgi:hypothetical protein
MAATHLYNIPNRAPAAFSHRNTGGILPSSRLLFHFRELGRGQLRDGGDARQVFQKEALRILKAAFRVGVALVNRDARAAFLASPRPDRRLDAADLDTPEWAMVALLLLILVVIPSRIQKLTNAAREAGSTGYCTELSLSPFDRNLV